MPPSGPARILVVDDEPDVLASLQGLLEVTLPEVGEVDGAASAEEAWGKVRAGYYDLILCDHKLPGRTGVELLAEVRAHSPTTWRVLMTAYADLGVATDAIERAQVHGFVEKPFDPEDLLQRVRAFLARHRAAAQGHQALARSVERYRQRLQDRPAGASGGPAPPST